MQENTKKTYEKPAVEFVELVPEEVVSLGCWNCTSGGSMTC